MAFIPYISELQRLVATTAVLAAAAFTASSAHAADESKGKKVLLLESFTAHPYVATTEKSFRERALSYGMEVTVQAAGLDAALQARQADDGIARKFDLIVIQPISEQGSFRCSHARSRPGFPLSSSTTRRRMAPRSSTSPSSGRTRTRWDESPAGRRCRR